MGTAARWRSGSATDTGRVREENQDRCCIDDEQALFLVVDGVGGRAAGGVAAEIAVDAVRSYLAGHAGEGASRLREAIAHANKEIFEHASANEAWRGMACVLTAVVVEEDRAVAGHVGDSRLYLIWNGGIRRLTSDHSPVGEMEVNGELTEEEAMRHPRRHEVFRDVGSRPHTAADEDFIEIKEFPFKPDAALLLCSDGLSDALPSQAIQAIVERHDGDAAVTARALVDAANEAGSRDNITAVFVAGPDFLGAASSGMEEARERFSVTRPRLLEDGATPSDSRASRSPVMAILTSRIAFLVYGLILGLLLALRYR